MGEKVRVRNHKKKVGGFTLLKVIHNIKNQNFYRKKANEKANTLKSIYIIMSNLRTGVIKLYTKISYKSGRK